MLNDLTKIALRILAGVLHVLTWVPLAWTVLILPDAKFYYSFRLLNSSSAAKEVFIWLAVYYIAWGGLFIWIALLALLTWKKVITKRQSAFHALTVVVGILAGFLSIYFDVFCLRGCYID